jgi:hypothetical protein
LKRVQAAHELFKTKKNLLAINAATNKEGRLKEGLNSDDKILNRLNIKSTISICQIPTIIVFFLLIDIRTVFS